MYIDVYTTTGANTWNKRSGVVAAEVAIVGGGGGGGSGGTQAVGSICTAGGGGSGGAWNRSVYDVSILDASETVTIGAGGAGGASQTLNASDGNAGVDGGVTTFCECLKALGGLLGSAGRNTNAAAAGGAARVGAYNGLSTAGQASSSTGAQGSSGADTAIGRGAAGAAAGGGITAAEAVSGGGSSALTFANYGRTMAGQVAGSGTVSSAANASAMPRLPHGLVIGSCSGGGGAARVQVSHTGVISGHGCAGVVGGGGGGGGAARDGGTSGAGGRGGDGMGRVLSF